MNDLIPLSRAHCIARRGSEHKLSQARIRELLPEIPGWELAEDGHAPGAGTFSGPAVRAVNAGLGVGGCGVEAGSGVLAGLGVSGFVVTGISRTRTSGNCVASFGTVISARGSTGAVGSAGSASRSINLRKCPCADSEIWIMSLF